MNSFCSSKPQCKATSLKMQRSKEPKKQKQLHQLRGCSRVLCCSSCRLSVSSTCEETAESSNNNSDRLFPSISALTHAMVQERLEQMIRERPRARKHHDTKFIVMVAMEKSSFDPREDFRESIEQMIVENRIREAKDLRRLLNCYVSMNAEEYRGIILEVFHDVCTNLFVYCKCN